MADFGVEFVVDDLPDDEGGFDPIPAGDYIVKVHSADIAPTKDGTGRYIKLRLDVVGPEYANRVIFTNLNIENKSEDAVRIAQQHLKQIGQALGLQRIGRTEDLIGGELKVKVSVKNDATYGPRNEVKRYMPVGERPNFAAASTKPAESKPPWAS